MKSQLLRAAGILRSEGPVALMTRSASYGYRRFAARFQQQAPCAEVSPCPEAAARPDSVTRADPLDRQNELQAAADLEAKVVVMKAGPVSLTIESTTYCNIKCVMCPQALADFEQQHLDEKLLEKLTTYIQAAKRSQLHGIGEVMVSRTFWSALDTITHTHTGTPFLSINTNALLLNEKNAARLLASKISELNVSFDATTADTYQKIRGGDFNKLLNNVRGFMRAREAAGRHDLRVVMNMTLMRANIEELPDFIRMAKELGADEVQYWRMNDGDFYHAQKWVVQKGDWRFSYLDELPMYYPNLFNSTIREALRVGEEIGMSICKYTSDSAMVDGEGTVEDRHYDPYRVEPANPLQIVTLEPPAAAPQCVQEAAPAANQTAAEDAQAKTYRVDGATPSQRPKSEMIRACNAPWHWMMVRKDGGCAPCCHMLPIGNLNQETPEEFWNGPAMQEIRSAIAVGEVSRYCAGASCPYVRDVVQP